MPTREKFFERPNTVRDMIGGRILLPSTPNTLVDVVDGMKPGKAILVEYDIVPEVDPEHDVPYCSAEGPDLRGERFLKRGPQIDMDRHYTLDSAVQSATAPHQERSRKFNELSRDAILSGYGWWGIRERKHRKVHLTDCIEGAKIFAYSMQNQHDDSRKITTREYNSGNRNADLRHMGGDYILEVSSTTEDGEKHDVLFSSVPLARGLEKFARVYDLDAEQSSKAVTKRVTKRYTSRELSFGKHAVAAYIELARLEHEKGNNIPIQMCPFALPTQKTIDFYNRLQNHVMVKDTYVDEAGKESTKKRSLNKAEKEILLWQFVAKHGPKETLFADKIQNYNWQRMYEPAA